MENCSGNNGRLISRTGAVFLIVWTPQGAVLAGTESSVPDSFPPLAIASLRAVCQWCCTVPLGFVPLGFVPLGSPAKKYVNCVLSQENA